MHATLSLFNASNMNPGDHQVVIYRKGERIPQIVLNEATCVLEYNPDTCTVLMVKNRHTLVDEPAEPSVYDLLPDGPGRRMPSNPRGRTRPWRG